MDYTLINKIGTWAIVALICAITVAIIIFIIFSVLYTPSFLQKKINLTQSEDILKHNLEVVEKAIYFETNQEFNNIIQEQLETIRANSAKKKSLYAEIEQLDKDLNNKKRKT